MATIKKKDVKQYKVKDSVEEKEELEELVNADGSPIEGSKVDVNDTEIETAPQQTSDEFAASAIQPNRYFYGIGGTGYSHGARVQSEGEGEELEESVGLDEVARAKMRKMVEDLLSTKNGDNLVSKYKDTDINRNDIPDLSDLAQSYQKPIPAKKAQEMLDTIQKNNLNGEEVAIILNFMINNIDTSQIPNDFRRMIKNNL